jgi:hypothetical protein
MSDRIERLRALKRGLPTDLGAGAPVLRQKLEADSAGATLELDEDTARELVRLLSMIEVAFLAAAADGELGEAEVMNIAANLAAWLGGEIEVESIAALLDGFHQALEEQGFEARLATLAEILDPDSRRVAYNLSSAIVVCDAEVHEEELGILGDIAGAFEIPEDEAQARFHEILDGMQAAMAAPAS